uniref:Uncharacterized protein n=1 Tax=Arundo donax TaxID=35708 RepID=A0A0A8ZRL5_ARUDO
MRRACRTSRPW